MSINVQDFVDDFGFAVFHDVVYEATGESFVDQDLDEILNSLPDMIKQEIVEWGISDTLTRNIVFDYLSKEEI